MINEELDKIKYLFGYKKGVVISEQTTPTSGGTTGDTTTQTTTIPQKIDLDGLKRCSGFKSDGKLIKGEEKGEFIIFNDDKGTPICKEPKETP